MYYIQFAHDGKRRNLETIDKAATMREAARLLVEYQLAFGPQAPHVYLSRRPCRSWRS
jgi:hypothetical protein